MVFGPFWSKKGHTLCPFWSSWNQVWFSRELWVCMKVFIISKIEICEFEMALTFIV